jgi:hypothetical protein
MLLVIVPIILFINLLLWFELLLRLGLSILL